MRLSLSLVTCIALAAIGCGGGGDATGRGGTGAPQIPLAGQTTPTASAPPPRIGTSASPTYLTAPPGDKGRLFVVEQAGTIREIRDGRALSKPFLDIRSQVLAGGERGLLSMAFAPDYAKSH